MKRTLYFSVAVLVFLCAGGGLFLYQSGFFHAYSSVESFRAYIDSFAPYSQLCFFLVQFLSVVLAPIPSNISAAAGGLLFGTWTSFFLTFFAVAAGSLLMFQLARSLGQPFTDKLVSRALSEKYLRVIEERADLFLLLAFLFPFFPDDVLCILAGLSAIPLRRFATLVFLARPWGLLFASALGGTSLSIPLEGMVLLGLGGAALFLLGMKYGPRIREHILHALQQRGNRPPRD